MKDPRQLKERTQYIARSATKKEGRNYTWYINRQSFWSIHPSTPTILSTLKMIAKIKHSRFYLKDRNYLVLAVPQRDFKFIKDVFAMKIYFELNKAKAKLIRKKD